MFDPLFFKLKEFGVPVSPTAFLTLHRAVDSGLVGSIGDLYVAARTILIKSEKYFDTYDQIFTHLFEGVELVDPDGLVIDVWAQQLLDEWLSNPREVARYLQVREEELQRLSPEELLEYFKARLQDQEGRHDGGSKWIGTGGTSPVGHSGFHPGGMRVGGASAHKSAVKVAADRRYKDYSAEGPLTSARLGEALKRLRNMVPQGAKDRLNVDKTIYQTTRNGGEIELIFERDIVDRLKVLLLIDNGGWSMEPYVHLVQALFNYARAQFKELKTCFFHNTIYDALWEDATRRRKPLRLEELSRIDPDTRLILVGDASMAPYELMVPDGSIYISEKSGRPSIDRLRYLADTFKHSVWLNPVPQRHWGHTHTIGLIGGVFPMFELSLDGLEKAVECLLSP